VKGADALTVGEVHFPDWHFYFTTLNTEAQAEQIRSTCNLRVQCFILYYMHTAKIIDIRTRKSVLTRTIVTREEFAALADKIRDLAKQLRNTNTRTTIDLLAEMKLCACFNAKFRNKTYPELEELYNDLRKRINKK
jgi:hypothetical protein